ncbi:MAG: glycosyltransferase [Bacteroidales bacterium]|nr:glycosyltransferase [Bacteroidales bacterium]
MAKEIKLSIIVPVFNRPDEVAELLASLNKQTDSDFEVLIIEDGSSLRCEDVCKQYEDKLDIHYYFKPNSGRSETRNYGMDRASGNYFIIFDSDCIMPPQYIQTVKSYLNEDYVDCYGGPDAADSSFNEMQKAISYAMTSMLTTGGIRGATKNVNKFSPRSFNMGIAKEVYERIGGYKNMIGEDIDLSFRINEAGFKTRLFPKAYVYHKRRVSLKKFFRQVNTFGKARILLNALHPGALKLVHWLPACFVVGNILLVLGTIISLLCHWAYWWIWLIPIAVYVMAIFVESLVKNKSLKIACISIAACYCQLFGYGTGFINEFITRRASKKSQEELYK